jgi:predicted component of type VI protein secretion system
VGLTEDEFEDFIRRDTKDLFNNVSSEKLQALATVIDKKDFIDNYGLTED